MDHAGVAASLRLRGPQRPSVSLPPPRPAMPGRCKRLLCAEQRCRVEPQTFHHLQNTSIADTPSATAKNVTTGVIDVPAVVRFRKWINLLNGGQRKGNKWFQQAIPLDFLT